MKSFQAPLYLAVIFITVGTSADKYKIFVLTVDTKKMNKNNFLVGSWSLKMFHRMRN